MLPLITLPTETLREVSQPVTNHELSEQTMQQFCADMVPAMYTYQGIGLAAPQVDHNIRICVIGKDADRSLQEDLVLINPEMEIISKRKNTDSEGCLSVPGAFGHVKRASHIQVRALGVDGQMLDFEAKGFFARVIQHEIDHLNGILFIDRAKDVHYVDVQDKVRVAQQMKEERKKKWNLE